METNIIISIISIIFSIISIIFFFFFFRFLKKEKRNKEKKDKENDEIISINFKEILDKISLNKERNEKVHTRISDIKEKQTSFIQMISQVSEKIESFKDNSFIVNKEIKDEIKSWNEILYSNQRRGELGEISLKWVLSACFGENDDIIKEQYTMKNGKRPDFFLKTNNGGIAIDSKFPFNNFSNILKLKNNSIEYKQEISRLKLHLKKHINDVSSKYISEIDNVRQVFLFFPSESLFSFIHSKKDFDDIRRNAINKEIILTSSSNLPAALRLISLFERDKKIQKNISNILKNFSNILKETNKVKERWKKIEKKIETIIEDKRIFNISIEKLIKNIEKIIDSKEYSKITNNKEKINENDKKKV